MFSYEDPKNSVICPYYSNDKLNVGPISMILESRERSSCSMH